MSYKRAAPGEALSWEEDYSRGPACRTCGLEMERVTCWHCHGAGGFHDCGDDCCPCLDKEEITYDCQECQGEGRYWVCGRAVQPGHGAEGG